MKKLAVLLFILYYGESCSQWVVLNSGTTANLKTVFFTGALTGFAGGAGGLITKTTNGGLNWNTLTSGLSTDINSIAFYNFTTGFACANSGGIIMTTNAGANWSPVSSGVSANLNAVSFSNTTNGICSGTNGTILFTTNGGLNWTVAVDGFITTFYGAYMYSATDGYACGVNTIFQPLIAKTTNGGANWSYAVFYLNGNEGNLRDIHFISPTEGIAVSNVWNGQGGISRSTNSGANWTSQLVTNALNGLDVTGNTAYGVGINGSVIKSTDAGISWIPQQSNVSGVLRSIDFTDSLNGYACGDGGIIIRTTNGGITSLVPVNNEIPKRFVLHQNYPNPFNPSTNIRIEIPAKAVVSLAVFDILGKQAALLVNSELSPGIYEISWNAGNLPSGIYYYRANIGEFTQTRKMVLLK